MKFLCIYLMVLSAGSIHAQTRKPANILDNTKVALMRIGLLDKIELGEPSAKGGKISAKFYKPEDKESVLTYLKQSKDFKSSNGLWLFLSHRGAKQSFRQLSDPSLHIIWYEDRIEIHFDMHCPGLTQPIKSYRHFREVVVNWLYRSATSQRRVALGLEHNKEKGK